MSRTPSTRDAISGASLAVRRVKDGSKIAKVADVALTANQLFTSAKTIKLWYDQKHAYLLSVAADDVIYPYVHQWVLSELPADTRKSVVITSQRRDDDSDGDGEVYIGGDDSYKTPRGRRVIVSSNDEVARAFTLHGHKIKVWVDRPNTADMSALSISLQPDTILFRADSKEGQAAVQVEITRIAEEFKTHRKPRVNIPSTYGSGWMARPDLPLRPLESVFLAEGQSERVVADIQEFLDSEQAYISRGMPWHRGYLFYGPPGTGKTSLARALAQHFGIDLWYLPLSDMKDQNLQSMVSGVSPKSILLLEDIDVLEASHSREGKTGQVTLSGLLNTLDGVLTPHGLITIMTSNHEEVLDPALVRTGRMDVQEHLDSLSQDQAQRMFEYFYKRPAPGPLRITGKTASDLFEDFKRNMHHPENIKTNKPRAKKSPLTYTEEMTAIDKIFPGGPF